MTSPDNPDRLDRDEIGPPPADELDALLKAWHQDHAARAEALRGRLMRQIAAEQSAETTEPQAALRVQPHVPDVEGAPAAAKAPSRRHAIRRLIMNRYSAIAASLILAAGLAPLFWPTTVRSASASNVIMAPDGGRLDALDSYGNVIGPCALKHTDVGVEISGLFSRVTVRQQYHNPYSDKIEALYTFPLSHRSAVDRMTMTVGDRVIVGEVHERTRARAMYEAAREQGYVASLLEQKRPNIFTQSVANIEPNADVLIEISYVELLEPKDGLFSFEFPMVVGPRYIPGGCTTPIGQTDLPADLRRRSGIILLAPADLKPGDTGDITKLGQLDSQRLTRLIREAIPILQPEANWWKKNATAGTSEGPALWCRFEARYPDGSKELGTLHTDGTSQINGRWFYVTPSVRTASASELAPVRTASASESASARTSASESASSTPPGQGFAPNTDQVPDASRITPMPVRPGRRAGHDISLHVTLDAGGPGLRDIKSKLHEIVTTQTVKRDDGLPGKISLELMKADEIPNRDFVLNWRQTDDAVQEATFTHTGRNGNFFTLMLQPPARVAETQAVPRELIFVLDTSGSMSGFPVEKAKEVMRKAIDSLRPQDTFNLITFSGDTRILWNTPRPFNPTNRDEAQAFLSGQHGSGGTEMMKAINAALVQKPLDRCATEEHWLTLDALADLPADGRRAAVRVRECDLLPVPRDHNFLQNGIPRFFDLKLEGGSTIRATIPQLTYNTDPHYFDAHGTRTVEMKGKWITRHRERLFEVEVADFGSPATGTSDNAPMRIVCFMTDGFVGNDMAIIDAVKKNAQTTRVFSFGIGNSVNRYLLESMAKAGRGEVEYVLLSEGADEKVARFIKRIQTPVLTDIQLSFAGLEVSDMIPATLPDLFDSKPLIIHGRYTQPGTGTLTVRGRTAAGPYERKINLNLPASEPAHDTIATLWARARVEDLMNQDLTALQQNRFPEPLKQQIIAIGEQFRIMTQFTSFVAIEKARVTIGGQPRLVAVPIEMPHGVSFEGVFGSCDALRRDCLASLQSIQGRVNSSTEVHDGMVVSYNSRMASPVFTGYFDLYFGGTVQDGRQAGLTDARSDVADIPGYALAHKPSYRAGDFLVEARPRDPASLNFGVAYADKVAVPSQPPAQRSGGSVLYSLDLADSDGLNAPNTTDTFLVPGDPGIHASRGDASSHQRSYGNATFSNGTPPPPQAGSGGGAGQAQGGVAGRPAEQTHPSARIAPVKNMLAEDRKKHIERMLGAQASDGPGSITIVSNRETSDLIVHAPGGAKDRADLAEPTKRLESATTQPASTQPAQPGMADLLKQLTSEQSRQHARQTLLPERIVLLIAALVRDGKLDEARDLANALATCLPDFALGIKVRDTLADTKLTPADRTRQIEDLARQAREPIDKVLREATLWNRLASNLPQIAQAAATQPADKKPDPADKPLMVTVLVADASPARLDALKRAGLAVQSTVPDMKLVVGTVPPNRLAEIALVEGVRRIEPTDLLSADSR